MKKVFLGLLVILIVLAASAFILIPKRLTISKVVLMHANENAVSRYLSNEGKWAGWWPSKKSSTSNESYTYNGFTYSLKKALYQAIEIKTIKGDNAYDGKITMIQMPYDTVAVRWETTMTTSTNPLSRFLNYREAKTIRKNMEVILENLKTFNENTGAVYGSNIHRTTIKDTFLVASKITGANYPSTKEVYSLVGKLKKYIQSQGAKETNFPMLNVTTNDSIHYTTMVAIPTDRKLEDSGDISFKQMMIYKDKTVVAEVKGGSEAIKKAYEELNIYMNDYNLSSPVIHWESLITDRSKQPDSTKWITKIFMPIV